MMKFIVGMPITIEVFYELILSFWMFVARHAYSTQNNKFAISLQYHKENVKDKVEFLPTVKQESFLQVDTVKLPNSGHLK